MRDKKKSKDRKKERNNGQRKRIAKFIYCIRKQKGDIDFVINGFHIRGRQMSTVKGIVFEVEGRGFKPPPWLGKAE